MQIKFKKKNQGQTVQKTATEDKPTKRQIYKETKRKKDEETREGGWTRVKK